MPPFSLTAATRGLRGMSTSSASPAGDFLTLPRNTNQALGIGKYVIDFIRNGSGIAPSVYQRAVLFHADSVLCGLSALALQTNAPTILRNEALKYPDAKGASVFGNLQRCAPEKAVVANSAAVREWDSNGTLFGFNAKIQAHRAGEFGHNDFYPVIMAASQAAEKPLSGREALRAMICLDEVRGRLAEVFSLKTFKIDHVLHGAVASAAVYGAIMGATAEQIESAIGMTVAHYVPYRAIRAGKQLSDSKGASAAISAEAAVLSMRRAMCGFVGPKDIFRNPESVFRWNEKTNGDSPFDLILATRGDDFAIRGMHFKLGLYEHQSAGALEGTIQLMAKHPEVYKHPESIDKIEIVAYEPAFGIIGDPAKRNPQTRQSADHSMVYIVATLLRKAVDLKELPADIDDAWCSLMLSPFDYSPEAIQHKQTRALMEKINFTHGGAEYDAKYPDGIPTSVRITLKDGKVLDSGFILHPTGHCRNTTADLERLLMHKFAKHGELALPKDKAQAMIQRLMAIEHATPEELQTLYGAEDLMQQPALE